ncbi:glycosyltransferase family 4 protein [Curtobacterium ammoniigenes]|uniref:glycosyltransferase family 4 protein n=1 Tax=Curtobacterium ammoniigenes TaxID=395387 RepID=UPI000AC3A840|nr:glycosyltransferase family 1 protein [Curtobacterium ammoniigenes]
MQRLSVLLDATSIPPTRGGVARYISGLLRGLEDAGFLVDVVAKPDDVAWLRAQAPAHRYLAAPEAVRRRPVRFVWEQLVLPRLVARLGATTLHSPHYTFPIAIADRTVVTLHDATFFSDPAAHSRLKVMFFRFWTRFARRAARALVTPSAATAAELDRTANPTAVPTVVAHLGVDLETFHRPSPDERAAFAERLGLTADAGWIAFLGTIEPRKQVPALIAAHRACGEADSATPPLIVAGGMGWDQEARNLLEQAGNVPGRPVRAVGYLPIEDLAAFLGGATIVVYPSIAEGFGLPVLEAMATGGNVLTTRRLAIPEVGGDAVSYAEPSADALAEAMRALLDEDAGSTARRRSAAHARAAEFTWRRCAEAHLAVYS